MAARENQGLQIALIVFVIFTILFSVSTYMLFSRWKESEMKTNDAQTKMNDAVAKKQADDADLAKLKTIIGASSTDDVKAIQDQTLTKINTLWRSNGLAALPDDQKNLTKVIDSLDSVIRVKCAEDVDSRKKDIESVTKQIAEDKTKAEDKLKVVETARAAAVAELDRECAAYKQAVDDLKKEKDQLVQDKTEKNKSMDEMKSKYEAQLTQLKGRLAQADKDVVAIKTELKKYYHLDPAAAGGYVTWINQRDNLAYINLGWDDGLHRRITFSVYPPGTTDVAKATAKGKIEVVNVTGPHLAEARIVDNPINNPLLPGDLIHTQGWHPGQHEHFGIAGFIDIDGNGLDQTRKLHDLIQANGGIVDAEIVDVTLPNGKKQLMVKGAMTVNTRYLIMGAMSADKPAIVERIDPSTALIKEAKRLNVEQIGLQKFLAMMGYTPHSATSSGPDKAAGAGAADNGGFRPRHPPARGADNRAF